MNLKRHLINASVLLAGTAMAVLISVSVYKVGLFFGVFHKI